MDIDALQAAAQHLREKLEYYKLKDPTALLLLTDLQGLLLSAELGHIHTPVEARDIPGYRLFTETNLQSYKDLEAAYTSFYIELTEARQSGAYKMLKAKMNKQ